MLRLVGVKRKNMEISISRAETIKNMLINKGFDGNRIDVVGKGDIEPLKEETKEKEGKNSRFPPLMKLSSLEKRMSKKDFDGLPSLIGGGTKKKFPRKKKNKRKTKKQKTKRPRPTDKKKTKQKEIKFSQEPSFFSCRNQQLFLKF